jgi:hypothetical protein
VVLASTPFYNRTPRRRIKPTAGVYELSSLGQDSSYPVVAYRCRTLAIDVSRLCAWQLSKLPRDDTTQHTRSGCGHS